MRGRSLQEVRLSCAATAHPEDEGALNKRRRPPEAGRCGGAKSAVELACAPGNGSTLTRQCHRRQGTAHRTMSPMRCESMRSGYSGDPVVKVIAPHQDPHLVR